VSRWLRAEAAAVSGSEMNGERVNARTREAVHDSLPDTGIALRRSPSGSASSIPSIGAAEKTPAMMTA